MKFLRRALAVFMSAAMIMCFVPFAGNAIDDISKPTFSLNVVSETDEQIVLSINLESGMLKNGKFQLVYGNKISDCEKIVTTEFFRGIISEIEDNSGTVLIATNPQYAVCSAASTVELSEKGAYFSVTLKKSKPVQVVSKDVTMIVEDIEANVVNNLPDVSIIEKTVTYNYSQNGGTSATKTTVKTAEGENVDLTPKATKNGWVFVGWNSNPNAKSGISSLIMGKEDITLYAVFQKTLTATFIDYSGIIQKTRKVSVTIYNNETSCTVSTPSQNDYTGWTKLGWAVGSSSFEAVNSFEISSDTTYYGLYGKTFTLSYDANGGVSTPSEQKGYQLINCSDKSKRQNPAFTLAGAIERNDYYFAGWAKDSKSGKVYSAGSEITIDNNAKMYATWKERERVRSVSADDINVCYKRSAQINYKITADAGVTTEVEWKSSNPEVATVDENGVVYAVKKGTAKITCTVTDQYGHTVSDTCNVNAYIKDDLGDVNGDGLINSADALMVLNYNVKKIELTSNQKKYGDVNRDGRVDSLDALYILRFAVEEITEF